MKKIKFPSIAIVLFFAAVLTSCSSDSSTPEVPKETYKSAFATNISGPETGKVNQELSYEIAYMVENGCGDFNKLVNVEFRKESGYQIEAKYPTNTCTLLQPEVRRYIHKISWAAAGTYYVRFAKSDDEFITAQVVIK